MCKISELRERDVINLYDGKRLGSICDIDVDPMTGRIQAVVVPGPGRFLGLFGHGNDYVIPWERIIRIGPDVILVDLPVFSPGYGAGPEYGPSGPGYGYGFDPAGYAQTDGGGHGGHHGLGGYPGYPGYPGAPGSGPVGQDSPAPGFAPGSQAFGPPEEKKKKK